MKKMEGLRKYIRKIVAICLLFFLFPFVSLAEGAEGVGYDKPFVPDRILQNIFQFSPFYSRIVDEYKADLYLKEIYYKFDFG